MSHLNSNMINVSPLPLDLQWTSPTGSGNLEAIHIIKKPGGTLKDSYLDEGYILDKKIGVGQVRKSLRREEVMVG